MSRNIQRNKGFSVVELIVIISLFSIMSSVVFFDFNTFKEKIDRANLTTDLALAFRQMQVYGISASNREIGRAGFTDNVGNIEVAVNADLILDTSSYGIVVDFDSQVVTQYKESGGSSSSFSSADEIVDVLSIQGDSNILYACVGYENGTPLILADGSGCSRCSRPA